MNYQNQNKDVSLSQGSGGEFVDMVSNGPIKHKPLITLDDEEVQIISVKNTTKPTTILKEKNDNHGGETKSNPMARKKGTHIREIIVKAPNNQTIRSKQATNNQMININRTKQATNYPMIHIKASNTLAVSNSMPWLLPYTLKDGKNGAGSELSSYDVINVSSDIPVSEEKMKTSPPIIGNRKLQNTRKQVKKRLK